MRLQLIIAIIFIGMTNSFAAFGSPCNAALSSIQKQIYLDTNVLKNGSLEFIEHTGPTDDPFGSSMAMNIQYAPIIELRHQIENTLNLNKPLNFFKAWDPSGEAHVTTITPVEYFRKLKDFVPISKINQIAKEHDIQTSDLTILGIGSGRLVIEGKNEETYFVILKSENLLKIRRAIYKEFLKAGGPPDSWSPDNFYPHITIGYTLRDLHENDGVLKDIEHSQDNRFNLIMF